MNERIFPATLEQLESVQAFISEQLERYNCPAKLKFQLDVAVEEIFVNIAHYAYRPEQAGEATVRCCVGGSPLQVTIQFLDNGKPFNPLAKEDADKAVAALREAGEEAVIVGEIVAGDKAGKATVKAQVVSHGKGDKIIVFKYKAKKNIRKKQGHRQPFTKIKVTEISVK